MFNGADSAHMARALQLAARGRYGAHPNPMVGCVLVRDGEVVGEGWHALAGDAHAEIAALEHFQIPIHRRLALLEAPAVTDREHAMWEARRLWAALYRGQHALPGLLWPA